MERESLAKRQPLAVRAALVALGDALLMLLVAFGVDIDEELRDAILVVLGAAGPAVTALLAWFKVTPVAAPMLPDGHDADGDLEG